MPKRKNQFFATIKDAIAKSEYLVLVSINKNFVTLTPLATPFSKVITKDEWNALKRQSCRVE